LFFQAEAFHPMSALPPKADIAERDPHVRFVPEADIGIPDQHSDPLSLFYEAGGGMVPRPRSQSSH
jgi:hypothetical protein